MEHLDALPLIAIVGGLFLFASLLPVLPLRRKAGARRRG